MSAEPAVFQSELGGGFAPYRSISKAAVVSLFLALLSVLSFFFPALLVLPVVGALLGLIAIRSIRRYPHELSGIVPAVLGTLICVATFVAGTAMHSVVYATEVPEGYERISFETLKAGSRDPDVPPEEALALNGKRVFIKGYIYPGEQRFGLRRFVLVPDLGTCCFGGNPRLTHMIEVTLTDSQLDYSMRKRKLGGVLTVDTELQPTYDRPGVYYTLMADHAE